MMMAIPQNPSPPHFYPQALQLKLYQAFIFSIPILFSIILFLLFYLFYLKRRASSLSASQPILPITSNQTSSLATSTCEMGLKGDLKAKLPIILFDEELRARDSQCCVCLGEFELTEELHQVPSCKHVFHVDCLRYWLCSNSTCPLCRCLVTPATKPPSPGATPGSDSLSHSSPTLQTHIVFSEQPQPQPHPHPRQEEEREQTHNTEIEVSSRSDMPTSTENEQSSSDPEHTVVRIQTQDP